MRDRRLGLVVLAAVVAVAVGYRFSRLISHDVGWMLFSANQMLDGAGRLYRDIFVEVNPPLALFLKLPAVLFARATGFSEVDVFLAFVFLLGLASVLLISRLTAAASEIDRLTRHCVILGALLSLLLIPGPEFGQREHFLLIFCLPYFVLSALRSTGHIPRMELGLLVGFMAALGFVLKPHFLLLPALVEAYVLARTRKLSTLVRPEMAAMSATGITYALIVLIVTPEYLTEVLPMVIALYNDAVRNPLLVVLNRLETLLVPLALILHVMSRRHQLAPAFGDVFAIAAVGFYAVYVIQLKGWHYHALPSLATAICTFCVILAGALGLAVRSPSRSWQGAAGGAIVIVCVMLVTFIPVKGVSRHGSMSFFAEALVPIIEKHAPGGTIYSLSSNVWTGFPAVNYSQASWGSRYSMLWTLPAIMTKKADLDALEPMEAEKLRRYEAALRDSVVEDLTRNRPDLIILDDRKTKSYFAGLQFDYIEYFASDPRFRRIWSAYDQVESVGHFLVYKRRQIEAAEN